MSMSCEQNVMSGVMPENTRCGDLEHFRFRQRTCAVGTKNISGSSRELALWGLRVFSGSAREIALWGLREYFQVPPENSRCGDLAYF